MRRRWWELYRSSAVKMLAGLAAYPMALDRWGAQAECAGLLTAVYFTGRVWVPSPFYSNSFNSVMRNLLLHGWDDDRKLRDPDPLTCRSIATCPNALWNRCIRRTTDDARPDQGLGTSSVAEQLHVCHSTSGNAHRSSDYLVAGAAALIGCV